MQSPIIRIDDRLIHGQVVVGWGSHYGIRRYTVANDEIASSDWERDMVLMAAPDGADAAVVDLDTALGDLTNIGGSGDLMTMILLRDVSDLNVLAERGLPARAINVGGIHYREGREEITPYIFLSQSEIAQFNSLISVGFDCVCQDLPSSKPINLESVLG